MSHVKNLINVTCQQFNHHQIITFVDDIHYVILIFVVNNVSGSNAITGCNDT